MKRFSALFAIFLTLAVLLILPASAVETDRVELDLSDGSITIQQVEGGIQYTQNDTSTVSTGGCFIKQTGTDPIANTITVMSGAVDLWISGLNVEVSEGTPFDIQAGASVELTLYNTSYFKSTGTIDYSKNAGIHVPETAALTITGTGALYATGGYSGAGIGSGYNRAGGTITINDGTVNATGGYCGAGIGGGCQCDGGTITINGGTVTATGGDYGAGIGGGTYGDGGTITINDGTVTATGGSSGAGIGGDGGTITINDGTVTATGGRWGAGIGSGSSGDGGTITINGGNVHATGGNHAAGIGGGDSGDGGTVTITGGTVTATGGESGAGIGGGIRGDGGSVTITGGSVTATRGENAPYDIGGGYDGQGCDKIDIGPEATVIADSYQEKITPVHSSDFYALKNNTATLSASGSYGFSGLSYQWQVSADGGSTWADLADQTGDTLSVTVNDETAANQYRCKLTNGWTNVVYTDPASVLIFVFNTQPQPAAANTLGSALFSAETNCPNAAYRWQRSLDNGATWNDLPGKDTSTILLSSVMAADAGLYRCVATAPNGDELASDAATLTVSGSAGLYPVELDLSDGSITIQQAEGGIQYTQNDTSTVSTGQCMIFQSGGTTANTITVVSGEVDLLISGLNVEVSEGTPFDIQAGASVELTLYNTSYFKSTCTSSSSKNAGIHVPEAAALTINGTGTLYATGGRYCAGIGGGDGEYDDGGTITINGGTVTATGGYWGAGIGGGEYGSGGTITINDGTVTATSDGGAGIGGGYGGISGGGSGGTITINGGTVTATGGSDSAGIGCGKFGDGGTITINDGTVNATSGGVGAGIGGGFSGDGGTITINGGTVTATSEISGAGIGGGQSDDGGTITITGGTVKATGGVYGGADIGGGSGGEGCDKIDIGANATVIAETYQEKITPAVLTGGNVATLSAADSASFSGIAQWQWQTSADDSVWSDLTGQSGPALTLFSREPAYFRCKLTNVYGNVAYTNSVQAANPDLPLELDLSDGSITIQQVEGGIQYTQNNISTTHTGQCMIFQSGGSTANTITVVSGQVELSICRLNIAADAGSPLSIHPGAEVTLTLLDTNTFFSGSMESAGVRVPEGAALTLTGEGALTVEGGYNSAGMGGNQGENGGAITVNGGTITATGYGGAGMGGGQQADGGSIVINGGTVTAYGSAGLGGGEGGKAGSITITDGTVTATSTLSGSGMGGDGGSVTITGGTVIATGMDGGYAIGGWAGGDGLDQISIAPAAAVTATSLQEKITPAVLTGGQVATLSAEDSASFSGIASYQWQTSSDDAAWADVPGAVDMTLSVPTQQAYFRCKLTNVYGNVAYTNSVRAQADPNAPLTLDLVNGSITFERAEGGIRYQQGQTSGISATGFALIQSTEETLSNRLSITSGQVRLSVDGLSLESTGRSPFVIASGATVDLTLVNTSYFVSTATDSFTENAGIYVPEGASLTIQGDGALYATGGDYGAGIGGGADEDGVGGESGTIIINGGTVTATGGAYGAGIGGGLQGHGGTITINDGTVTASGSEYTGGGAGIGGGGGEGGNGGSITINGGTVTATGSEDGAGIGGGGIERGNSGNGGTITITGGTVNAIGGTLGAGIGGGNGGDGGTITISGGVITASLSRNASGAGIGGGNGGSGGTITINDGTVTATGGVYGGAGIGGGESGDGGTITINGGSVSATAAMSQNVKYGYCSGAGIGAGYDGGSCGDILITGGTVTAISEIVNSGIGGDGGTVTITGGTVIAIGGPEDEDEDLEAGYDIGGRAEDAGLDAITIGPDANVTATTYHEKIFPDALTGGYLLQLSATGRSHSGISAYQWQTSANGKSWSPLTDETGAVLNLPAGTGYYRCRLTNIYGNSVYTRSTQATLLQFVTQPDSAALTEGQPFTLAAVTNYGSSTYRWQYCKDSTVDWSDVEGATETVLRFASVSAADAGLYRCVVTGDSGAQLISKTAVLTVGKQAASYAVEHYLEELDGSYRLASWSLTEAPAGTAVSAEYSYYEGFTPNETMGVRSGVVQADSVLTLKLYYTRNRYTITFLSNGGSQVSPITLPHGAAVTAPADPAREGFAFVGWYSDESLQTPFVFDTMPIGGATLYAGWADVSGEYPYTINSVRLLDAGTHEVLDSFPAGNFIAEISVTNHTSTNPDAILLAFYTAEGQFLGLQFAYSNTAPGETLVFGVTIPNDGRVGRITVMVVPALNDTITPLAVSVTVQ